MTPILCMQNLNIAEYPKPQGGCVLGLYNFSNVSSIFSQKYLRGKQRKNDQQFNFQQNLKMLQTFVHF